MVCDLLDFSANFNISASFLILFYNDSSIHGLNDLAYIIYN